MKKQFLSEAVDLNAPRAQQMIALYGRERPQSAEMVRLALADEARDVYFAGALDRLVDDSRRDSVPAKEVYDHIQGVNDWKLPVAEEATFTIERARGFLQAAEKTLPPEQRDALFDLVRLANKGVRARTLLHKIDEVRYQIP